MHAPACLFDLDLERLSGSPRSDVIGLDEAIEVLGATRTELFDLVAAGKLRLFRSGAELLLHRARVVELRDQGNLSP